MEFPQLYRIQQRIKPIALEDVERSLQTAVSEQGILSRIQPGSKVIIAVGSRGICNYPRVVRGLVELLKAHGAEVSLLPAMGSHGGGTGAGQVHVLAELGLTPEKVGAPIIDTIAVRAIGKTPKGVPVYADENLLTCDHIILVNRIKVHTEFHGKIESGLLKMMAIGLGRIQGAIETHQYAVALGYEETIREVARVYLEKLPILGGIAMIDGPDNQTARIEVVLPDEMERVEQELLAYARILSIKLPLDEIDVLLVDQLGKNISGAGMDTKVIGRIENIYEEELTSPRITRIIVRDLTPETYGNAIGIGLADFTTQRCVEKIDKEVTYLNCITAIAPEKARIPITLPNDREALQAAFRTIGPKDENNVRLVWIKNTLSLVNLLVSSAAKEAIPADKIEVVGGPLPMEFDSQGNLISP